MKKVLSVIGILFMVSVILWAIVNTLNISTTGAKALGVLAVLGVIYWFVNDDRV